MFIFESVGAAKVERPGAHQLREPVEGHEAPYHGVIACRLQIVLWIALDGMVPTYQSSPILRPRSPVFPLASTCHAHGRHRFPAVQVWSSDGTGGLLKQTG